MSWQVDQPYNKLPPLPPGEEVESKVVLRQCIEARAALAELKQAAALIPNPSMLINTLPMMEAKASSEIENIVTTMDRLFEQAHGSGTSDPATKEALRYREALMEGFRELADRPLCTRTAETVCGRIKGVDMHVRKVPGTTLVNAKSGDTIYTPPVGEALLREQLGNWERYLHDRSGPDPLIRMAVAHYQFEAIHPFTDGNGRTGRVINSLFLIQEELLTLPILYLSRYIIANKADYYRRLLDVTGRQAWEPWLLYMLKAVEETARWTVEKISSIRELAEHSAAYIREKLPKIYSHELVNVLLERPYCRISNVVDAGIGKRETASRYLKRLVEIGVLEERRVSRNKLFIHSKLMALLAHDDNEWPEYAG